MRKEMYKIMSPKVFQILWRPTILARANPLLETIHG